MAASVGVFAKAYRCTGSRSSWGAADGNGFNAGAAHANLDEITNARDVTVSIEAGEADVSTRGNGGYEAVLAALKKGSLELQMVYDPTDADYLALMKAFNLSGTIAIAALDGAKTTSGTIGFWADFVVTKVNKEEPIDGAQMVSFTLKPTLSSVAPQMVKVS